MKICLLMLYTESWIDLSKIVISNVQSYAKKHGYDTHIGMYKKEFSGFEKIKWSKISLERCDVVWSLDMDTLITNHEIKLESFLDVSHGFYICKDYNGINAGSFISLSSQWCRNLLEYFSRQQGQQGMHCEQNAVEAYMREFPNDDKIKILQHPSINSYMYELYPEIPPQTHEQGNWQEGDFLLHLPGIGMNKRLEVLSKTKVIL